MTLNERDYNAQRHGPPGLSEAQWALLLQVGSPGDKLRRALAWGPALRVRETTDADRAELLEWIGRTYGPECSDALLALRAKVVAGGFPDDRIAGLNLHRAEFARWLVASRVLSDWPDGTLPLSLPRP